MKHLIAKLAKSAGPKKQSVSPGITQVAAVSVVVLLAVGAIIVVAQKATPAATAAPAKAVAATTSTSAARSSAPAKKASPATQAKPANAAGAAQAAPQAVTITGCLEQKGDEFQLKDTGGTDAPKSRSWKTLGLTKKASSVTLLDTGNRMKLGSHVGERVSVTGTLLDKDLQGKTLKSLTPNCD